LVYSILLLGLISILWAWKIGRFSSHGGARLNRFLAIVTALIMLAVAGLYIFLFSALPAPPLDSNGGQLKKAVRSRNGRFLPADLPH
jgi:membrane-associated protease RseP (regulator of RpoE activity)